MSVFVDGMECRLCGKPMSSNDKLKAFGPFVSNDADPLSVFHDGTFHLDCFENHPLAQDAVKLYELVEANGKPEKRVSFITGALIDDPTDYLPLGHLTSDEGDKLYEFNFAHFRKSELAGWERLDELVLLLSSAKDSEQIKGRGIDWIIEQLKSIQERSAV